MSRLHLRLMIHAARLAVFLSPGWAVFLPPDQKYFQDLLKWISKTQMTHRWSLAALDVKFSHRKSKLNHKLKAIFFACSSRYTCPQWKHNENLHVAPTAWGLFKGFQLVSFFSAKSSRRILCCCFKRVRMYVTPRSLPRRHFSKEPRYVSQPTLVTACF